ncbi:hypothetical protein OJAV_G00002600 [Oryzias javanicus]|uniref:Uncharacterized protein n=1 Tax=Oryzias javanicus TaxID=123683 RepID=A0A437DM67_ORYJA|nr:hypothetical protein OJAV_G00002600 [Oryzias javanicus]
MLRLAQVITCSGNVSRGKVRARSVSMVLASPSSPAFNLGSGFRAHADVTAPAVRHPEEKENGGNVPSKRGGEEAVAAGEAGPTATQRGTAHLRTSCY